MSQRSTLPLHFRCGARVFCCAFIATQILACARATAQLPTVELTAAAGLNFPDRRDTRRAQVPAIALSGALWLTPAFQAQVDVSRAFAGGSDRYDAITVHGSGQYLVEPLAGLVLTLGAGAAFRALRAPIKDLAAGPSATAIASYDLSHRLGVRIGWTGDFYPVGMNRVNVTVEPNRVVLRWASRTVHELRAGVKLRLGPTQSLPRDIVVLNAAAMRAARQIPETWDARYVRNSVVPGQLSGSADHAHSIAHEHGGVALASQESAKPLGLHHSVASAGHVHALTAVGQTASATSLQANTPEAAAVYAVIARRTHHALATGLIIGFVGDTVPRGWEVCDGTNGTPDLRDLLLVLRRVNQPVSVVGSATHSHLAEHAHQWSVATPNPELGGSFAFMGDPLSSALAQFTSAPVAHRHIATEAGNKTPATDATQALPRSVRIRFLKATTAKAMPRGALMPFVSGRVPPGWAVWVRDDTAERFVIGARAPTEIGSLVGTESHTHLLPHSHELTLAAGSAKAQGGRFGEGPAVALFDHAHRALVHDSVMTGPARNDPLHVTLRFLIKN